jgi:hypothetical protein
MCICMFVCMYAYTLEKSVHMNTWLCSLGTHAFICLSCHPCYDTLCVFILEIKLKCETSKPRYFTFVMILLAEALVCL